MAAKKKLHVLDIIKDIKKGNIHRLYVLKGKERYFHDLFIDEMKMWAEKSGIDIEVIYANEVSTPPENTGGGGLFSSGTLYIIKYWQTPKNKKMLSLWERFFRDDSDIYYVVSIDPDSRSGFTIKSVKDTVQVSCDPLKGKKLKSFLKAAIKKRGKDITPTALDMLVSLSGGNIAFLTTELDKLLLIDEKVVDENVISRYFALPAEGDVFVFWDALWQGNMSVASEMKNNILLSGTPVAQLMATIATFIRGVLEVGQLRKEGMDVRQIGALTSKNPFYISKLLGIYSQIGIDGAVSILEKLYELDKGVKTGEISDSDALEGILSHIISLRERVRG